MCGDLIHDYPSKQGPDDEKYTNQVKLFQQQWSQVPHQRRPILTVSRSIRIFLLYVFVEIMI